VEQVRVRHRTLNRAAKPRSARRRGRETRALLGVGGSLVLGALIGFSGTPLGAPGATKLEQYRVTRPEALLFDRIQRREALAKMPQAERERLCGVDRPKWPRHGVVRTVRNRQWGGAQGGDRQFGSLG
jgi:hypothetical protein